MSYIATVLKVMIASPSDVRAERQAAQTIIFDWNAIHSQSRAQVLLPVASETHTAPALGARAQEIINHQIVSGSDMLVAIFWTRLGTPTSQAATGTVEEIEQHVRAGKPVMLYFSNQPVRPDSIDGDQYKAMLEFKQAAFQRGLVEEYDSLDQFRDKFARQLTQTIIRKFPLTSAADGTRPARVVASDSRHAGFLTPGPQQRGRNSSDHPVARRRPRPAAKLAASFGQNAANLAAEAHRHLTTIAELAKSVQQTSRERGFDWRKFRLESVVRRTRGCRALTVVACRRHRCELAVTRLSASGVGARLFSASLRQGDRRSAGLVDGLRHTISP